VKRILLFGNPNVGKSAIFTRLTGVRVIASNYPGTTVEYLRGKMWLGDDNVEVIDVPGTYSLDPDSPAEKVAKKIIDESDPKETVVVNIIDSTNLERNLNLTLRLLTTKFPVVVILNFWDETKHKGISIDVDRLSKYLKVPVIPTVAITGFGIQELRERLSDAKPAILKVKKKDIWDMVGKIINETQTIKHHHHTFLQILEEISTHPMLGVFFSGVVLFLSFVIIRLIGEGLIGFVFEPIFENLWSPVLFKLSSFLGDGNLLNKILIGELVEGEIDFYQSFGLLSTGLFIPIAAVLPYIISFYFVLSILEDTGYLPRLAVLVDRLMHQIGIHGMGIVPMFLACGCNVPGVLATRIMETRRERFIAATVMSISIPCVAQSAMIFGLLGKYGLKGIAPVFITLFLVWIITGKIMAKYVSGESPEIFTEIPPYRVPYLKVLLEKIYLRVGWFLKEALPFVLIGVLIVNFFYIFGFVNFASKIFGSVLTGVLGLPSEAIAALFVGFMRKDVAIGMLAPLGLSMGQLITASVVLTMYFPCVATFVVLFKELGVWDALKAFAIMVSSALLVGCILNLIY
jgi:ferrous iron transport protein B